LDGKLIKENLQFTSHDESWLLEKIKNYQVKNINEIEYAEWNENDEIYIQKRED